MRPATGSVRLVRSFTIAALCAATAASAHIVAGGEVPVSAVMVLFVGASAVAWLVASRRVTSGQIVGLLLLCQVVVHLTCSMGSMAMSLTMLAMHAVATAVSALVLARGERFVWRVAERLGLRARPHLPGFLAVPSRTELVPIAVVRSLQDLRLAHSRTLRGPPFGCSS